MAAAIIPIVSLAATFLPALIKGAEVAIQGEKKGDARRNTVLAALRAAAGALGTSGDVQAAPPSDDVLVALIERELQALKQSGQLTASTTTTSPLPQILIRAALEILEAK